METLINPTYTKADIMQRMVFTIAKKWDINEKEVAARFDPLMMLLVEVIAQELDVINTQWELSVEEMTETMIRHFFPKYPIHTHLPHIVVIQATPVDNKAVLPAFFDFQLHQGEHTSHFTPIQETRIYPIRQHSLWVNHEPFTASSGFQTKQGTVVHHIGILCERGADLLTLDGLQMYVGTGTQNERSLLLYALQHGNCTVNGEKVQLKAGYKTAQGKDPGFWATVQDLSAALYQSNFITLTHQGALPPLDSGHHVWQKLSDKEKKEIDPNTAVYMQWELPIQLQERWLNQLHIYFNAFVGMNRKQSSLHHKLDEFVNIVPLSVDQHLLFVAQVKGDANEQYQHLEAATEDHLADGSYLLKASNFGKMSSDTLRNSLQDLKEQVNSNNAFFANVSNDYISRHLQEMQRILYRLEDKMRDATPLKQHLQYLLVKPHRSDKFVTVTYWTFDNRDMEKLRPETLLTCKGSLIEKGTALLVTKPYPLAATYKNALNQPLQQIVSKSDVATLARNVFGTHLDTVTLERVYQINQPTQQTKQVTLVLNIKLKEGYDMEFAQLDTNRIQYEMERHSLLSYPFSVHIMQP